jgi:hypothetical protein
MGRTGSDNLFVVFPRVEEGVGDSSDGFSGLGVSAAASGVSVGKGVALADGATEASGDEEADAFGDAVGETCRFFLAAGEALGDGVFCGVGDALCRFRGLGVGCTKKFFTFVPNDSSAPRTSPMRPIRAVIVIRIKERNLIFEAGFSLPHSANS